MPRFLMHHSVTGICPDSAQEPLLQCRTAEQIIRVCLYGLHCHGKRLNAQLLSFISSEVRLGAW